MINEKSVGELKLAVKKLFEDPQFKELLWLLEEWGGKHQPQYDPAIPKTMDIAHGKAQIIQSLRSINGLTEEQILSQYGTEEGEKYL